MQRNEKLEAYQKKSYIQNIATYSFTVGVGGVSSTEKKELKSTKSGVNLHFLRYGIFSPRWYYKTSFIEVRAPEDNRPYVPFETTNDPDTVNDGDPIELDEVFISGKRGFPAPSKKAPELATAQYRVTGIDRGYVYIHEKGAENFWLEFSVDLNGNLNPIFWKDNVDEDKNYKDIREVVSNESLSSYIVKEGAEIWVTHSLSQLSITQLEQYRSAPDDFERLQAIVCSSIAKTSDITERKDKGFRSFREFNASFTIYQKTNAELLQSKLNQIAQLEYTENRDDEDDYFEDVFILLEDPVQCANDLTKVIDGEIAWLKALTDTLKNGESAYDMYDGLMKLPIYSSSTIEVTPEEQEEIRYIFALALTTYKFIYDNEELKKDFSRVHGEWYLDHGIDYQKLDRILAISKRKDQRDLINRLRNDMGNFMKSGYYDLALDDFKGGSYPMIETAKDLIADHLGVLVVHPTMIDRHLLLASEYNPYEDKWIKQVRKTITGKSEFKKINELLEIRIPIDEVEKEDSKSGLYAAKFCKKFLSHFGKMLKTYVAVGSLSEAEVKIADLKVNYLTTVSKTGKVGPFFRVNRKEFLMTLMRENKDGFKKYRQFKANGNNHFTKTYAFLKVQKEVETASKNIARRTGAGKEAKIAVQGGNPLRFSKQLEKLVQSGEYKSAVLAFEVWALIASVERMYKEGFSLGQTANISGALIKTTAAALKLVEHSYEIRGVEKKILSKTAKVFSTLGSGVTVIMATKDAVKAFKASDNDASIAFSVAAGISGYLLAIELGAASLSTGPFIVVAGIGLAVYGIAYYLTDSDLEKLFKYYPFSTQVPNASNSKNPFLYARAMHKKRNKLIDRFENQYLSSENTSYKQLFVRLTNLLSGGILRIEGSNSQNPDGEYSFTPSETNTKNSSTPMWTSLVIKISFSSFLQNMEQVNYEVYLIQRPSVLEGKVSYRLSDYYTRAYLVEQENSSKQLQLWYRVSQEISYIKDEINEVKSKKSVVFLSTSAKVKKILYVQPDARIAVLCQMKGNEETIFPLTQNDRHGYLYTEMTSAMRDSDGSLIRRSFDPIIITKQAFLNAYPLQNPE